MNSTLPPRALADTLWLLTARARGGGHWLANAECEFDAVSIAESVQPVSLQNSSRPDQSYVVSPRSAWIHYAKDEALRHLSPTMSRLAGLASACVFGPLSLLMTQCGLDRAATVGNRLISTNLYPDWGDKAIQTLRHEMVEQHPDRPLMMRNICADVTPQLASALHNSGWDLVPARIVYLCDPQTASIWKHNHVKQDAKLLVSGQFQLLTPEQITHADLAECRALFRQLFIHKHSRLNPDFTPDFFELCLETGFLDLYALRLEGKIVGVLGIYAPPESGWITTPLIGYDTTLPAAAGVYRCLMALLLQQARQRQSRLHYSSGASQFKRARGGRSSLEYTAIYSRHLSPKKRLANRLFAASLQQVAPGLLKKADKL
ncbi:hypothetical protein BH11PSE12_BH11PSE12_25750 [soil metagenome]